MAVYTRQVFGVFGGNEQTVTLRFENRLLGVVLDRFGGDYLSAGRTRIPSRCG